MAYYKDGVDLTEIKYGVCESCERMFPTDKLEYSEGRMECRDCVDGYEIKSFNDAGMSMRDFV
jgi:RNA polymerase-binding transcription factor DksA